MPVYHKLVRDKIPQVIEAAGKTFTTRTLSDEEYLLYVYKQEVVSDWKTNGHFGR